MCSLCEWVGGHLLSGGTVTDIWQGPNSSATFQPHSPKFSIVLLVCGGWVLVSGWVFGCCKQGHLIALCACMSIRRVVHIHIFIFLAFSRFFLEGEEALAICCLSLPRFNSCSAINILCCQKTNTNRKQTDSQSHTQTHQHTHTRA